MAQKKFIIDGGFSTNADSVITGNLVMTGNVLPSINSDGVTGYDLGSPDFKWRDLFLSQGSLYIDGQKVLQSDSGTIVVSADPDQSLLTKTTGTGVLTFQSETPISIAGTLQMGVGKRITSADGLSVVFGDKIDMDSNQIINVGTPTAEGHVTTKGYVDGAITSILGGGGSAVSGTTGTFSSDVSIQGNLTVSGTTTTVNSETISLADNIIDLNSNMTSGTPTENAGIRIMRGDESAVQLRWNEATDRWTFTNDGTTYYPLVVSTTDLAEGTNLYFTDARAQAALASTVSLLQSADTTLQANITSEATARAAADTSIRTDFGAADATLQSNIDSEEAARIAGDSATLASAQSYADSAEADAIASANAYTDGREAAITSAYQTAIAAAAEAQDELNELVDVNITSVTNGQFLRYDLGAQKWVNVTANTTMIAEGTKLYFTDARAQAAVAADIASAIAAEASDRSTADANLQSQIDFITANIDPAAIDSLTEIVAAFQTADGDLLTTVNSNTSAINAEVTRATGAETTLQSNIDTVAGDLATEVTRATGAESDLQDAIDVVSAGLATEASTRSSADTTLQGNIDTLSASLASEASTRGTADATLQGNIDTVASDLATEASTRAGADSDLQDAIDAEATARASADTTLQGNIDAEASTRASADTTLQGNIDTVADDLAQELLDRAAGDAALQSAIATEAASRSSADNDLQDAIDAEATTRAGADATLQSNIDAEAARIDAILLAADADKDSFAEIVTFINAVDTTNDTALGTEITTRAAADLELQTNIDAEASVRQTSDVALQGNIDAEEAARIAADSALETSLQAYADTAEADAITSANAYTDGRETAITTAYQTYADQAEADAKAYTDTRETAITTAYQTYADQAEADAKTYADGIVATLSTSLSADVAALTTDDVAEGSNLYFTDVRAQSALTSTLSTLETSLQTYADSAEADAITSANAYTDGREVAITAAYEAYADSVVATEASARAAGDTSTLNSAQSYTDTAISNLVNGASAAYDTLKEIQDAMATDAELSAAISAITIGNGTQTISAGSYLTGGGSFTANQTSNSSVSLAVDATSANTASKVVARDASGNFSAGIITADLSGNASTATKWATARTNTVTLTGDVTGTGNASVDGSGNWTVSLATTVAANSVALGTDTTGAYVQDVVAGSGISISESASGGEGNVATISHADTSSVANVSSNNSGGVFIQDVALTFDTYGHTTGASVATATMTNFHSGVTDINSTVATNNASGSVNITFTDLVGAVHYNVYLNRILLRPSEVTVNTTTGIATFATGVLATDDELEVTGLKIA